MTSRKLLLRWPALLALAALVIPPSAHAQQPAQTARLVRDSNPDPLSYGVGISWVAPLGTRAVFTRSFLKGGPELWVSNGTPATTLPIRQAPLGPEDWHTGTPTPFGAGSNAKVAFYRISPTEGEYKEVWVTDGTDAGTLRVSPSPGIQFVNSLTATTSGVFFVGAASGSNSPLQLFFSDGSPEGARLLNPTVGETPPKFTSPSLSFTLNSWCYFIANRNEVWRSDGTSTMKLATIPVTTDTALSAWFAGSQIFVSNNNFFCDTRQLWSLPLSGGALTELHPPLAPGWWNIVDATTGEDQFFFVTSQENKKQLMASDGTQAGTRAFNILTLEGDEMEIDLSRWHGHAYCLITVRNGETGIITRSLYRIDGFNDDLILLGDFKGEVSMFPESAWREQEDFLYFTVGNAKGGWDLWQTKGTLATTRKAKGIPSTHYLRTQWEDYVAASETGTYYAASRPANPSGLSLWFQPRGKSGGAKRLTLPEKWTASGIPYFWFYPYPYKSLTYDMFEGRLMSLVAFGDEISDDRELWSMNPDGTRAKAIWKAPKPMDGNDAYFGFRGTTPLGSIFYYSDGHGTRRVYRTNGTSGGTRLLKDHSAEPHNARPYGFAQSGDQVFYSVSSWESPETTLWKTDGTPQGTIKIVAADGSAPNPVPEEKMASFQGSLYFLAHGTSGQRQLWRTDGTPAGTIMLKEWATGTPTELSVAGGKLLFNVNFYQSIVWQSDGTAAGTIPVPGAPGLPRESGATRFTDLGNGVALFQASPTRTDYLRWYRHDATGTSQLPLTMTGMHFFQEDWNDYHAVLGNQVIYAAFDEDSYNLWITDGTAAGTHRITDLTPNTSSPPRFLTTAGNHIYFRGWDAAHGTELWRTDGTEAGTILVADIAPGPASSEPYDLKLLGGKLYFSAYRDDVGTELFVIDLPTE